MTAREALKSEAQGFLAAPGVYLFRGAGGQVLYVGKAGSLRDRVRSYFQQSGQLSPKVRALIAEAQSLEAIVTSTENEALILEDALVKKHRPRFNARLRDDKRYPYIKITAETFPRVLVVRRVLNDGARYFGPYTSSRSMRWVLKLVHRLFPLRTCNLVLDGERPRRPCLLYHIGRCSGPCANLIDAHEYRKLVDRAALVLEGRIEEVLEKLRQDMEGAAGEERFEHAARLRDHIQALERVHARQVVALPELVDLDAVGVAVNEHRGYGVVLLVRAGRVIGKEGFALLLPRGTTAQEALTEFLDLYYTRATALPQEVLLPEEVPELEGLLAYLSKKRGARVEAIVPRSSHRKALVDLAQRNAKLALMRVETEKLTTSDEEAVDELAEALELSVRPWRIEAFDISNLQGTDATGSMVVFVGGKPRADAYRRFKVHLSGKPDDYAMMGEVLGRRLSHGLAELGDPAIARGKFSDFPDLILVDGGKGQLDVALKVLEELGLGGIEAAALAKREELVYLPGRAEPVRIPKDTQALKLLQRIRDEAHRFAIEYHRKLRDKRSFASLLDGVPGIGPKRKQVLLERFGSLEGLRQASLEDLLSVPALPRSSAELLYKALHP